MTTWMVTETISKLTFALCITSTAQAACPAFPLAVQARWCPDCYVVSTLFYECADRL